MKKIIKRINQANIPLKIVSLVFGYSFWLLLSSNQTMTRTIQIPLYLYNIPENNTFITPNTIDVTIQGRRDQLYNAEYKGVAANINAEDITQPSQAVNLAASEIVLPQHITVVDYNPREIIVQRTQTT
jgi:YbbR domain-containing protein